MQAGGKQSAAWAGTGCLGFVFVHQGPSSMGWPCMAGTGNLVLGLRGCVHMSWRR